jgi:hypothetical protein
LVTLDKEVEWWAIKILKELEIMKMDLNDHLLALEVEVVEEDIIQNLNLTHKPFKSIK